MSRGPGRLDRIIAEAFADPNSAYTTNDLLRLSYPGELIHSEDSKGNKITLRLFYKRQRVAIIRAAKRRKNIAWLTNFGRELVFYNRDSFESYILARLKDYHYFFHSADVEEWRKSDAEILNKLESKYIAEWTGAYWCGFQMQKAERNGDHKMIARLEAQGEENLIRIFSKPTPYQG